MAEEEKKAEEAKAIEDEEMGYGYKKNMRKKRKRKVR